MTDGKMPEWPNKPPSMKELLEQPRDLQPAFHELNCRLEYRAQAIAYERALAAAWEARARLAVEALSVLSKASWDAEDVRCHALDTMDAIGELPK